MNVSLDDQINSSTAFKEGFAEFYQFAVRNYAKATLGQESPWWDDNQEEASFASPRFRSIRYHNDASVSGFSCFLWNVYDKYNDAGFRASQYETKIMTT